MTRHRCLVALILALAILSGWRTRPPRVVCGLASNTLTSPPPRTGADRLPAKATASLAVARRAEAEAPACIG